MIRESRGPPRRMEAGRGGLRATGHALPARGPDRSGSRRIRDDDREATVRYARYRLNRNVR